MVFIYFVHKYFFKLIYSWLKEKEFVNVEDESFRKVRVINADRVFSSLDDFLWCKRSWFTSADRVFDNFREPFRLSFFESFSRGIFVQYMQKRMRVDVKESFSFREKYSKAVFDLSFSFSKFIFKFLNEAGKSAKLRGYRVGFKHLRVIKSKESQYFSIFFILFRGVVSRDKLKESVDDLGVKYEGLNTFFNKKAVKGDVESTRRFRKNDCVSKGFKKVKEIREALIRFLSLTPSSPVAGAKVTQPTYWQLKDRGTYSFGGLIAYKVWSPCPNLFYKTEKVSLRDILN